MAPCCACGGARAVVAPAAAVPRVCETAGVDADDDEAVGRPAATASATATATAAAPRGDGGAGAVARTDWAAPRPLTPTERTTATVVGRVPVGGAPRRVPDTPGGGGGGGGGGAVGEPTGGGGMPRVRRE